MADVIRGGVTRLVYLNTVNTRAIFPIALTLFLITSLLAAIAAAKIDRHNQYVVIINYVRSATNI